MATAQNGKTGRIPGRFHRLALLLFITIVLMLLAAVIMDLLLLYFHNIVITPWFNGSLLVLTIVGIAFSIADLFYILLSSNFSASFSRTSTLPSSSTDEDSGDSALKDHSLSSLFPPVKTTYRSIQGGIPLTDSRTIVQREKVVKDVYKKLTRADTTAIILTGMASIGKSTLAALVYRYVERQISHIASFTARPLWFTLEAGFAMDELAANLFEALGKPMPNFSNMTARGQAVELFKLLNATDHPRLIVLDQFERLLDWQSEDVVIDPAIREWLAALNSGKCKCRILFTSRILPQQAQIYPLTHIQEYRLSGLEIDEGIELLQKQGVKETEKLLGKAVEDCGGHPYALVLLASILNREHYSLDTLFGDNAYAQLWIGDVANNLLSYIYERELDENEHKLLLAFSVYREAVPLEAVQTVAEFTAETEKGQIQTMLTMLATHHLLQSAEQGHYHLHPIVAKYVQMHFVENDEQANRQASEQAHARAAYYYHQRAARECLPQEQRRDFSDVHLLVEAIWQYCQAEEWSAAYDLMEQEHIFSDLKRWGENSILLELCELFLPLEKWQPGTSQAVHILTNLGRVYRTLGKRNQARICLEQAVEISEKEENFLVRSMTMGMVLSFLGRVYADLGQKKTALQYLSRALKIRQDIDDLEGMSWTLDSLSEIYDDLGQMEPARQFSEQALQLREEIGDRRGIGRTLITLGRVYDNLGETQKAREYLEQALAIWKDVRDRTGEALASNRLGLLYAGLGEKKEALKYYEQALHIERETGDLGGQARTLNHLGNLYRRLGEREQALQNLEQALSLSREVKDYWWEGRILSNLGVVYYELRRREQALDYLEKGLAISIKTDDQRGEGWTKYYLGRIYADAGEKEKALKYFEEAWHIHKKVGSRRREGWILYGIGLLYLKSQRYDVALAALHLARDIFHEMRSQETFELDSAIEKLHEQVDDEQFAELLTRIKSDPRQLVEQALQEIV